MRKAGRFTAALLLIAVGVAVIVDQYAKLHWTERLMDWWPLLFIALGLEYIWLQSRHGDSDKPLKLDLGGLIFALIISAVVMVSLNSSLLMKGGWTHFTQGQPYDKGTTPITVPDRIERIDLTNQAGNVTIRTGNSDRIEVQTTVYVAEGDPDKAKAIVEQSRVEASTQGSTLNIKTISQEEGEFWGFGKIRIDLIVAIPEQVLHSTKLNLDLSNGSITAEQLVMSQELKGTTTNGAIHITNVEAAELSLQSTNAKIVASKTKGNMKLQTTNGSIEANEHQGDIRLKSTNGQLSAAAITGAIGAETTNGGIHLDHTHAKVDAKTTNGSIEVTAAEIQGDWDLQTTHGKIDAALPANGDFQVQGKGQSVTSNTALPLRIHGKEIDGKVGSGKYMINLDTNGSLLVRTSK